MTTLFESAGQWLFNRRSTVFSIFQRRSTEARRPNGCSVLCLMAFVASLCVTAAVAETAPPSAGDTGNSANSELLLIRVVDPAGHPIPIKQVIAPHVYINGPDKGWWTNKMPIERRLPDESILVPRKSLVLAKPGQKFELEFLPPQGLPMTASGSFPEHDSDPIVLTTESGPEMPDIDDTAGPSDIRTNEVAGRVVDPKGNPVAGAAVSLERAYPKSEPVMTDANGAFRFANQGERMWGMYLQVQKDGFGTRQITDVSVGCGFTIKLDDTTRLKGQFTLPDGKPAGKTTVTLTRNKKTMRARMGYLVHGLRLDRQTDDNGAYDFPLEPGVYEVQVASEHGYFARFQKIRVDAGKTTDLSSQLQPGVRLRLQTVDSVTGRPVSGVKLVIWDDFPGRIEWKAGSERVTDKTGFAEWNGLMPGFTSFEVIKSEYKRFWSTNDIEYERGDWEEFKGPPSMGRAIGPLNLDLRQNLPTVVAQIERGVHVHGKVVGPNSQPAGKMLVNLNVQGIGVFSGDARYQFVTDTEGRFSSYLPAGNGTLYNLSAHDPQGHWANAVTKTFGSKPGDELEFTLQMSYGGWISGRVVDRDGKPVPHVEVYSVAADQLDNPYFDPAAITDHQGRFKLGPMRAGDYAIGQRQPKTITHAGLNKSSEKHFSVSKGRTVDAGDLLHTGDSPE
ncbi:MAG: carboxypeptidase-like regulatory domain-containing protein [Verrucomicrobiia bacterium]